MGKGSTTVAQPTCAQDAGSAALACRSSHCSGATLALASINGWLRWCSRLAQGAAGTSLEAPPAAARGYLREAVAMQRASGQG